MSNEELVRLIRQGQDRQENLLELYNQNQGIIYKLCKPYSHKVEMADLLQEAFIVLAEAVEKFNHKGGYAFLTHFRYIFLNHFNRIVYKQTAPIPLPSNLAEMARRYRRLKNDYLTEIGKEPTDAAYCHELKITTNDLARVRAYINMDVYSLDNKYTDENGNDYALIDLIQDHYNGIDNYLDEEQRRELHDAMEKVLARLPEESAQVLKMRFYEQKTLDECGEALGKTKSAAQVCEIRALNTIRRTPESIKLLRTFVTPDEVYDLAMTRKGLKSFLLDGTSPTEHAAIKLLSLEEQRGSQAQKQTAYIDHIRAKYMTAEQTAIEV